MSGVTLCTGHCIDAAHRAPPRFPAETANTAKLCINAAIKPNSANCSLANGVHRFVHTTASEDWKTRFHAPWNATQPEQRHILKPSKDANSFAACNGAMLEFTKSLPAPHRLLALWNGEEGDGEGGTSDLIHKARAAEFEITGIEP